MKVSKSTSTNLLSNKNCSVRKNIIYILQNRETPTILLYYQDTKMKRSDFFRNVTGLGLFGFLALPDVSGQKQKEQKIIYMSFVRGLAFSPGKKLVPYMKEGDRLDLRREPDNKYDSNAIALCYNGQKIGYVAAEDNYMLSQLLDAGHGSFSAEVDNIHTDAPVWQQVSYRILSIR